MSSQLAVKLNCGLRRADDRLPARVGVIDRLQLCRKLDLVSIKLRFLETSPISGTEALRKSDRTLGSLGQVTRHGLEAE